MSVLVPYLSGFGGLLSGGVAMWMLIQRGLFTGRIRSRRNVDAELEAKDRTIATNEQTITALTERLTVLESDVERLKASLETANTAVAHLEERYQALQAYAAPQAFHTIDVKLNALLENVLSVEERAKVAAELADRRDPTGRN